MIGKKLWISISDESAALLNDAAGGLDAALAGARKDPRWPSRKIVKFEREIVERLVDAGINALAATSDREPANG